MSSLQSLRQARSVIRWMLVWFALSIGVAVAAPVVNPQALTLVCTTAGVVKLVSGSDPVPEEDFFANGFKDSFED